ncbi:MAG TPA: DUF481 domain-containing protein [Acidobacteriaceae bacterium]|nr:DUF481 domain-containing protein [Acidobacteriaceae bacterium]
MYRLLGRAAAGWWVGLALVAGGVAGAQSAVPADAAMKADAAAKAADVVVFKNGDRLTGRLERGAGNSIVFKSDMAGEITIPLDQVKQFDANGSFAVLRKDEPVKSVTEARKIVPGTVSYSDGTLAVAPPVVGAPVLVPEAQIANIIDAKTYAKETGRSTWLDGWSGAVNGGATIVRATDYGETLSAGVGLVRTMPQVSFLPARNRTTFNLQETYGKLTSPVIPATGAPAAVTLTSIFHADAEQDEYFTPRVYALEQTAFDHNYSQGLKLQQVYGGGLGWTVLKSDKQELDLKGTAQYEMQQYIASSGTPDQNIIGSTLSEAYRRNLPRKLVFTESVNVLPAWNETRDYSANGSVGLAMPVFKRLSLQVTTTDNYLNDPAIGYKKNSYQFVTGVSYALK